MTRSPRTVDVTTTLAAAGRQMAKQRIRHLPVKSAGKLVGILSDRDVQMAQSLRPRDPDDILVEEAMTPGPWSVAPDTSLDAAARIMARHKMGSAVVVDGDDIVGVFTTTDALRALSAVLRSRSGPAAARRKR